MDAPPFDRFARALAELFGRRAVAQGLFGLSLATLATGAEHGAMDVEAKNKNKKKRRRGKKNKCNPDCTGKTCGSNGCGGNCGSCAGTEACLAGA
jgi:hypothetical protein